MQGEMTPNGERFECIIDDRLVIVYLYAGQYIGYPLDGGMIMRLTENEVREGVEAKMDADIVAFNATCRQAVVTRGSYYGD